MKLVWIGLIVQCIALPSTGYTKSTGPQRSKVDSIIIHAIGGPICKNGRVIYTNASGNAAHWKVFFENDKEKGIHYIIDRGGAVVSSVPENQVANHALGRNLSSIGIELVNRGDGLDPFPEVQISALIKLVQEIKQKHNILFANISRHSDVDKRTFTCGKVEVKTKQDPGAKLKWPLAATPLAPESVSGLIVQ